MKLATFTSGGAAEIGLVDGDGIVSISGAAPRLATGMRAKEDDPLRVEFAGYRVCEVLDSPDVDHESMVGQEGAQGKKN